MISKRSQLQILFDKYNSVNLRAKFVSSQKQLSLFQESFEKRWLAGCR